MFALAFEAGGEAQVFFFINVCYNRNQSRLALGQRSGFVDDERRNLFQYLKSLGILDQHSGRRSSSRSNHY